MSAQAEPFHQHYASDPDFERVLVGRGIEVNGVQATFTPGKGRGIIANRHVKEGERLVHVPASSLFLVPKIVAQEAAKGSQRSVHGSLTLRLLQNEAPEDMRELLWLWKCAMPDLAILKQCMPLLWPGRAQQLLPEQAKDVAHLQRQRTKFARDWNYFRSLQLLPTQIGLPEGSGQSAIYEAYICTWLLVNSRSFYWDYPMTASSGSKLGKSQAGKATQSGLGTDDCMALVPFIDLFNHTYAGESCEVVFNYQGFSVMATRDYESGEEVFVTYGNHSNEFLLVEYGFMMDPNVTDCVSLDAYVIPEFSKDQRAILEDCNLFGSYNLYASTSPSNITPPTYCYRTQCALRALVLPPLRVRRYVHTGGVGDDETPADRNKIYEMWKHICGHIFESILKHKNNVETELEEGAPQEILLARWNQISDMVFETLED